MLVKIQPLLSVDLLMQRTFLATLRFEALDILKGIKFDFLVACAFVDFSLNQMRFLTSSDIGCLKLIIPDLVKHGKEENITCGERCNVELHSRQRAGVVDVVLRTIEVLMTNTYGGEMLQQYLQLFSEALRQFELHDGGDKQSIQNAIIRRTHKVLTLTLEYFQTFDIFYYLVVVNGFFNVTFTNEKANYQWNSGLLDFLVRQINNQALEYLISYYCNNDLSAFHVDIQKAFSDKAFGAIIQVMKNPEKFFRTFSYSGNNSKARITALFSHFVNQSWDGKIVTLEMCLTWRALSGFFRQSDSISILDENAQTQVLSVKSKIEDATARLTNGDVIVEELRVLLRHKEHFLALCEVIDVPQITRLCLRMKNVIGPRDIVSKILECRETELTSFEDVRYRVGILLDVCSSLHHDHQGSGRRVKAVDVTYIEKALETNMSCRKISDLCDPIQAQVVIISPKSVTPVITFFKLSPAVSDMLVEIEKIHESRLFQEFWRKKGTKVLEKHTEGSLMTLQEVESQVWRFVKEEWDKFRGQLTTGLITLLAVKNKLGEIKDDLLEKELGVFKTKNAPNDWIGKCCKQVRLYRQLGRSLESAKIILKIKNAFDLTGNFKPVELLCSTSEIEFEKNCLKDLNTDVATACKELEGVTEDQKKCLHTLMKCKDLIIWIKKEIKNMQELKVFVDLAMIQAGETDIEVGRVSCLHQAATGYAAFIFDLTEDSDYTYLMRICNHTWTALQNDPELSTKLEDIHRHMEWLKGVKDSHGSVEVTSLRQVERINAGGIYEIGKLEEHTLILRVPVEDDEEKIYTVEQLKDLQSKLMLVAGKAHQTTDAKSQVDRFVEVFDGAQDLEMYYKKMCTSGNVLFTDLNIKLICDKSYKVPVHVDFCVVEQKPLFGRKELTEILKELLNFMDASLKQWYDYIDDKREEFYFLNVYTTKQLVILRRALANFGEEDVSPEVYALLSLVKPDCTVQDLRKAVAMVKKEKEIESNDDEIYFRESGQIEDVLSDEEKDRLVAFWDELDGMLDEEQAMAVLEDKGIIDVEDAVTFMTDSPYSKKTLEDLVGGFYSRVGCALSELRQQNHDNEEADREEQIGNVVRDEEEEQLVPISIQNLGHGTESVRNELLEGMKNFKGTLIEKLNHLWKNYLSSTKSADLSDYVSVETLGRLLKHLAPDCQATVRCFPQLLTRGRPNLILCPARDVLHTVLSVYMEGNGSLPAYDEVLLCNAKTSLEEVVLLWRRALNGTNVKTYCLVNADALDYDVSVDAVKKLHQIMKGRSDYQLVIVCNREREDQSRIVTALNSDRISSDKPTCRKWHDIQEYLCMQFTQQVQLTNGRLQPAATLTNQKTCVQAISSKRPGVGKSLLIQRYKEQLQRDVRRPDCCITVPLQTTTVQEHDIAKTLISRIQEMNRRFPRIIHLDVSPNVCSGLDHLLFNLLILNTICCPDGSVWRRHFYDLYLIEVTHANEVKVEDTMSEGRSSKDTFFESLPTVLCRPPKETHRKEFEKSQQQLPEGFHDPLMDVLEFRSPKFQRPYQYLARLDQEILLDAFTFNRRKLHGNHVDCLATLLRHCGLPDPSWSELSHFACFLNKQLEACEGSVFCDLAMLADTGLDGFKTFVVKFMLQMSKDFATPSLQMSDESFRIADDQEDEDILIQLRRRWETSPHPYIFFNRDHQTMTFMGFSIDRNGTLFDVDGRVLQQNVMTKSLMRGLDLQRVNLAEDFDSLPRDEKLRKLCMVMGIENVSNPDDTYELTTDNVKKILAIHMRFRCGIPVIVMGETGCGKTRLIRFMCQLQSNGLVADQPVNNMILMKVHGGTSSEYIVQRVRRAEGLAKANKAQYNIDTVLFFDEANTTEAIGIIKEIMCDGRMNGRQIDFDGSGLKIVAACNPYKRHTDEMIGRLEAAGLGYHIKASETKDRLGRIPLRQLVYRVQALPPSMLPLVWDFGQLNSTVETMYISQIVQRFVTNGQIYATPRQVKVVSEVLSTAQAFMREQKNECSFVSLRDVERTLNVMVWFFNKRRLLQPLIEKELENAKDIVEKEMDSEEEYKSEDVTPCDEMDMFEYRHRVAEEQDSEEEYEYESEEDIPCDEMEMVIDDLTWALVLALGVCYHACLDEKREYFRDAVAESFSAPLNLYGGSERIYREINSCQDIFLDNIQLGPNIARNLALKENIFMMIICIELRIPLFLVGKPGSSKSLAKTIVADAMQGDSAASDLFKELKQVHMISYQCSPLSTPDGIVGTFRQCSRFQESKDLNKFVSVVVLDEVGLAEDSPRMPLKTLHPLLEYGSEEDDNPPAHKKVAFIGISNWALDPAKMNRGILVSRGVPNEEELIESAKGICASKTSHSEASGASHLVRQILKPLAQGYLEIYRRQDHDFFGLRDFYSLIKMVNQFAKNSGNVPTWAEIEHAIRRNFGGLSETEDHIKTFKKKLEIYVKKGTCDRDPDCSPSGLIKASLDAQGQTQLEGTKKVGHGTSDGDSRYLLVLTEKFAALPILQEHLNKMKDAVIIYGSSFPFDQEYTQVCRNINRIKLCMEAGRTVVLLNLENLYESLYDALNQYYVYFGGQRYVDLGLGNHRVKCRVHESFRLIVVADKEVVHERFPIPLINRLEKHFLAMTTMLNEEQQMVVKQLEDWVTLFTTIKHHLQAQKESFKRTDAFVGYHGDTIAALVYQTWASCGGENEKVVEKVKDQLLTCATPESVTRLSKTNMSDKERESLTNTYFRVQKHGCLADYLADKIQKNHKEGTEGILAQVTTYSHLLIEEDSEALAVSTRIDNSHIKMISLKEFQHEQQFSHKVQKFFDENRASERLLLVQCDASSDNTHLISCASYRVQDERENALSAMQERMESEQEYRTECRAHVVFIIQLPRVNQCFDGFQGGLWASAHIDDLQPPKDNRPDVYKLMGRKISDLFTVSKKESQEDIPVRRNEREVAPDGNENLELATPVSDDGEESMDRDSDDEESMEGDSDDESNSMEDNSEDAESMEDDSGDEDSTEDMDQEDVSKGERANVSKVPSAEDMEQENEAMTKSNIEEATLEKPDEHVAVNVESDEDNTLVDFTAVLLDSIHPATARISDPTNQKHRSTERVRLLVNLLKGDSPHREFLRLLKCLVIRLVEEKDSIAHEASQWLTREALDIKEVQESGTFRQACWQRLTATVAPFLAEVIAICDICNNLSLLESQEADNAWLHELWLSIFSSVDLINISYDMCLSPEKKVQRSEVQLQQKGYGGKSFKALFPFSWIIKGKLEDIWKFASEAKVEAEATDQQFLKFVQESEVGTKLQTAITTVGTQKVVQHYCSDFIRMTCKISQEKEHKLICDHIINASYSIVQELGGQVDSVNSVAAIHLAFNKFQARFEHLSQLVDICPDVLNNKPEQEVLDTEEMTIDVTSLKYVLGEINSKDFKSQDGQRKWLSKIHTLCPVVQSMMGLYKKKECIFGPNSQIILEECRCLWSRINVMKLFFEHVCLQNEEFADIVSPKCRALWVALKKTADLKLNASVKSLVNILNEINKKAGEKYYKSGIHDCGMCGEAIKDPVLLPCKGNHVFCKECIKGYFKTERVKICAVCKEELPQEFECKEQSKVSAVVAQHNAFRQCCNSFFMEVVSQLCFADGTPPSEEVIKRLLGYVTIDSKKHNRRVTRNVSPFPEDCIDPNPVVRSFLLQLLLQSNLETVKEHVQEYLGNSRDLMERSDDAVSLCRLFVNCLEDTYYSGIPQDSDTKLIRLLLDDALRKLENSHHFFDRQNATADPLSVELLEAISQSRFALTVLADIIQRQQQDQQCYSAINIKRLVAMLANAARRFCQQNKQAQLYLVKYICRAYSKDALTRLKDDEQLNWILPNELKAQYLNVPDNFVIVGETYTNIREAIGQCVVDNDFEKMCKVVTNVKGNQKDKEVCFLLALFREITMNATTTVEARRISLEVKRKFGEIIQDMPFLKSKIVADTLLQNRGQNPQHILRVTPGLNLLDYSIQAAVTHLQIVLNVVERQSLTQCLATLMRSPSQMQQAYLPAMPQDDRMEAQAALHQATADHNLTWYECPNGHLYTIGNCGRPNGTGFCSDCNVRIGGQGYAALPGNKVANMVDTTRTGHVLGYPQVQRGNQIVSERTMSSIATAVVRFLLHASMLLGTESQQGPQPIINMITPHPLNVLEFLWHHLHNDVRLLSIATGKNRDDCIFILHKVIDNILHKQVPAQFQSGFQQLLSSKKSRKVWEENFTKMYITPLLQGLDEMIDLSNQTLIADKRLSDDPLMRLLHTANAVKPEDLGKLVETSHVWQYRSRITIQCIHHALANEEDGASLQVLRLFMEKEKHLRVVRHLPDIIRLQRLLINKYNRHIDSAEAINLNISRFLDQVHASEKEEFKRLIDIFIDVWNSVKLDVELTVKLPIPKECCSEVMSYESNIAMLLPTRRESGLCSTGLVDFLIFTQNEFLERYHSIQELQMSKVKVDPSDLLMSHLIAYDPDRDLLPLILSQCQYIVRPMAENKIEYNLQGLELQLIERFVRGRAFIDRKFDQLFFRQDVRNASIFESLRDKIPQVELPTAVQSSIVADLKSFQDLCKSLASLDIAIGFLANYKSEGDMLIKKYLQDKLAMPLEKGLCSSTASQQCRLKHVLALWQVLAVEKALRLANDERDPFDGIEEEYRKELDQEQKKDLVAKLRFIKVDLLCAELYEYIVLNLGRHSTNTDEDRTKWPILDTLDAHYTSKYENSEIPGLGEFPGTLLLSQAVETWKAIAQFHCRQSVQG
ncbi:E3 ubiquitin-protein ligase RNF213-like [Anneissia japonica]|uniref:E3 ubiquitin-protein ligase RNF213-like n=1 Tax=Anneissia japonica TaxID=1529436 RepID=UPI0014257B92|nr:E3 ubiquitin-protein ligase RNF213-like [Anneissia japonica]